MAAKRRITLDNLAKLDPLLAKKAVVTERGCWEYGGSRSRFGYGKLERAKKSHKAHRYSWLLFFGDPGEMKVCHTCDNPPCFNPNHMFLGSHVDNMRDMVRKGRHGMSSLTNDQVDEIRQRVAQGEVQRRLAVEYGVHSSCINRIVRGLRRAG